MEIFNFFCLKPEDLDGKLWFQFSCGHREPISPIPPMAEANYVSRFATTRHVLQLCEDCKSLPPREMEKVRTRIDPNNLVRLKEAEKVMKWLAGLRECEGREVEFMVNNKLTKKACTALMEYDKDDEGSGGSREKMEKWPAGK